jgi:hypothetical protein
MLIAVRVATAKPADRTVTGTPEDDRQPAVLRSLSGYDQSLLPPNICIGLGIIFIGFIPPPPRSSSGP